MVVLVGKDGTVLSAAPKDVAGLSDEVAQCIADTVKGAHFEPPEGGEHANLEFPVRFTHAEL
jgi:hypothetical protein